MENPVNIELLFTEYYVQLHRYAFTILKNEDEAKDVVQNVFVNLWEKSATININSSPKAYLFRSVYNESINHIRKQEVQQKHYSSAALQAGKQTSLSPDKEQEEEQEEWKQKIKAVLDVMPPQCREVFMKSRAEQKKYTEIAIELGIAVKTVEAHMSKALKLIRQIVRVLACIVCLCSDLI